VLFSVLLFVVCCSLFVAACCSVFVVKLLALLVVVGRWSSRLVVGRFRGVWCLFRGKYPVPLPSSPRHTILFNINSRIHGIVGRRRGGRTGVTSATSATSAAIAATASATVAAVATVVSYVFFASPHWTILHVLDVALRTLFVDRLGKAVDRGAPLLHIHAIRQNFCFSSPQ
jgi:hypothetical protein